MKKLIIILGLLTATAAGQSTMTSQKGLLRSGRQNGKGKQRRYLQESL
jgi:hypothetical protein